MDDQKKVYLTRSKRGNQPKNASDLPAFGIATKDNFAYSPHTLDLKAGPSIANFDLHAFRHHPDRQMPSQKAHNTSSPLKRKYQVTTMADSPLKLRISSTDGCASDLDGTVDNPSPWDALAGEDADSDDAEPISDRHASSSGQQAGSSVQTDPTCPFVNPDHAAIMEQGGELYQVVIRPFLSRPNDAVFDIYERLCEVGLAPICKTGPFGFMFAKPASQALPFQSEAWVKISQVKRIEE